MNGTAREKVFFSRDYAMLEEGRKETFHKAGNYILLFNISIVSYFSFFGLRDIIGESFRETTIGLL